MTPRKLAIMISAAAAMASACPSTTAWDFPDAPDAGVRAPAAADCDPLPDNQHPIRYDVTFEGDIRPFVNNQCGGCHGNLGGLSLAAGNVLGSLLRDVATGLEIGRLSQNQPTPGASVRRVAPGRPTESMLFLRINCGQPGGSLGRMPLGGVAPTEFQALVYDWIASGALMPNEQGSDRLTVGGFESIVRVQPQGAP